jgi:hypothetical protein
VGFRNVLGSAPWKPSGTERISSGSPQISFWEIAIKINIGKLEIPIGLSRLISLSQEAGIDLIPVSTRHIIYYQNLERKPEHRKTPPPSQKPWPPPQKMVTK